MANDFAKMARLLSPCPYCGSQALAGPTGRLYRIDCGDGECSHCPVVVKANRDEAVNAWESFAALVEEGTRQ